MNYNQYQLLFDDIIHQPLPLSPYDRTPYMEAVKLNQARMKRWDKTLELSEELLEELKSLPQNQHWIIITEPWCIEAAHIIPFLVRMAEESGMVTYDIQLRDSEPFLINAYLTNGAKGIPKMVVRNEKDHDLFTWGPRPAKAQTYRDTLHAANYNSEGIKYALQKWYNADKGKSLSMELLQHYLQLNTVLPS